MLGKGGWRLGNTWLPGLMVEKKHIKTQKKTPGIYKVGLARIGINGVICWYCYWLTKVFLLTLRFHDPRGPSESNQNTWPVKRFQWKNIFIFGVEFISGKDKPYWLRWSFRRCPFRNLSVGKRRRWLVNKMRAYFPSYSKLGVNHYLNRSLARGTWMSQDVSKWFVNGLYRLRSIYGDEILPSFMEILIRHFFWIPMNQCVFHGTVMFGFWTLLTWSIFKLPYASIFTENHLKGGLRKLDLQAPTTNFMNHDVFKLGPSRSL